MVDRQFIPKDLGDIWSLGAIMNGKTHSGVNTPTVPYCFHVSTPNKQAILSNVDGAVDNKSGRRSVGQSDI